MHHGAQSLPLKFLLLILKFRGAKGFEETILPPTIQKPITAICAKTHIGTHKLETTNPGMSNCPGQETDKQRLCPGDARHSSQDPWCSSLTLQP